MLTTMANKPYPLNRLSLELLANVLANPGKTGNFWINRGGFSFKTIRPLIRDGYLRTDKADHMTDATLRTKYGADKLIITLKGRRLLTENKPPKEEPKKPPKYEPKFRGPF